MTGLCLGAERRETRKSANGNDADGDSSSRRTRFIYGPRWARGTLLFTTTTRGLGSMGWTRCQCTARLPIHISPWSSVPHLRSRVLCSDRHASIASGAGTDAARPNHSPCAQLRPARQLRAALPLRTVASRRARRCDDSEAQPLLTRQYATQAGLALMGAPSCI